MEAPRVEPISEPMLTLLSAFVKNRRETADTRTFELVPAAESRCRHGGPDNS